jgi:hypothetical protein
VRSLQYIDALQLKMAVFKLFNKKAGIAFQGPETPFGCFEVSVTNTLRISTSFSHFHWMLIECFENGILGLKDVQISILHELLVIVLPNGDTFLHRLLLKNLPLFEQLMEIIIADNKQPNSLYVVHLIPNA